MRIKGRLVHQRHKGLTLALAGYREISGTVVPFLAYISNVALEASSPFDVQTSFFKQGWMYDSRAPADRQMLYINGAEGAFTARNKPANTILGHYWETKRLLRKIDLGYRPESRTTADKLAWLIRQATKHPHYGPYIGSDCLSVVLHPDNPGMPTHYHPEKATAVEYGPHLVTPMLSTWDVEFNLDPKPLDLTDPEDDKKTFPGSPGNVASHRDTSGNVVVREGADGDSSASAARSRTAYSTLDQKLAGA